MQLKKLVAGALGALMVGATAGLSATLADYPAPFAANGSLNSVIVVGAAASSADVIGAANVGARLAGESYTLTTAGTTTGTVSGGSVYSKDVAFDTSVGGSSGIKTPLKSSDVTALKTGTLSFDGSNYNWEEAFSVESDATLQIETSATSGGNKDFKDAPYLRYGLSDMFYNWTFTTALNSSKVSTTKPLTITMLGKTFKITELKSGSFTATAADEKFLKVGESYTVTDSSSVAHTVTLVDVASDAVVVKVDSEQKTISTAGTTTTVGGIDVKFVSSFYKSNDAANSGATLQAGSDITKTYTTGDAFPGENKDNPTWIWDLSGVNTDTTAASKHSIRVKFNKNVNLLTDTPAPLGAGQSLNLPNNYLKFGFDSVTTHNKAQYKIEYVSAVDISNAHSGQTAAPVIKLSTTTNDGFTMTNGSAKTKTIYVVGSGANSTVNVTYVDANNKVIAAGNYSNGQTAAQPAGYIQIADIVFQDTTMAVWYNGTAGFRITNPSTAPNASGNVSIAAALTSQAFTGFGTANTADASDVNVHGTDVGTRDEDTLTSYGVIVRAPKSNAGSDRVVMDVPSVQLKGFVSVKAGSGSTTGTTAGQVKQVVPVKTAIAKLDKDAATDVTAKHAILVGGPCANTLVQQLATANKLMRTVGNSSVALTCTGWLGMNENFGVLAVVNDAFATGYAALVVAGTRAEDTTLGTQILQDYETYKTKLAGNQVEYSGASLSAVTFK